MAADRTVKLFGIGYIEVIVLYPFLALSFTPELRALKNH